MAQTKVLGNLKTADDREHRVVRIGPFIMVYCQGHRTFMQSHPGDRWTEQVEPFGLLCAGCAFGRPPAPTAWELGDGAIMEVSL